MEDKGISRGNAVCTRAIAILAGLSWFAMPPAALAGPDGTDRPLRGSCHASFDVVGFEPGPPPVETLALDLSCSITHLGLTAGAATQRVTLGTPPWSIATTIVYGAANGDVLRATFSGTGVPQPDGTVTFAGVTTYIGGTGRFLNANGVSVDSGSASLITNEGTLEISGKLSY